VSVLTKKKQVFVYLLQITILSLSLGIIVFSFSQLSTNEVTDKGTSLWTKDMKNNSTCKDPNGAWLEYRPMRMRIGEDTEYLDCPWRDLFSGLRISCHAVSAIISILNIIFIFRRRHNVAFWILIVSSMVLIVLLLYSVYRDVSSLKKSRAYCDNNKNDWQNLNPMNPNKLPIVCSFGPYIITTTLNCFSILWLPCIIVNLLYMKIWKRYNVVPVTAFDTL